MHLPFVRTVCVFVYVLYCMCEYCNACGGDGVEIKTDLHAGDTISRAFSTKTKQYGLKRNMRVVGWAFSPVKMNQDAIMSQTKAFTVAIYFKSTQVSWGILSLFTANLCKTYRNPLKHILL